LKNYPDSPKTLGEYLFQKRGGLGLSRAQFADLLGLGVTDGAVELWEKGKNRPTPIHRAKLVEFLGFDPELTKSTGGS
jgi:transcriptional regulator with XRE-family HTH domain